MMIVSISLIPTLQEYLGLPYDVALAFVVVYQIGLLLPALLGSPIVGGWITPAIPLVLTYLGDFEPGPEAIRAMVALQLIVFLIFFLLGITKLGGKLIRIVPASLKSGILIGAGLAAFIGEIEPEGRVMETPISLITAGILLAFTMFSLTFQRMRERYRWANFISNFGMMPPLIFAIFVGWAVNEFPLPDVEWGITSPAFGEVWAYLPFSVGLPDINIFLLAIPTAIVAYIIAYGDMIVGDEILKRSDDKRKDEKIDNDMNRLHLVTSIRNLIQSFFGPYTGLSGPIWTAIQVTVAERYNYGRKAMDSFHGGAGTFTIAMMVGLFMLPIVTFFEPTLEVALSTTLLITGYVCVQVGIEQVKNSSATEIGVASLTAMVLAVHGAEYGLMAGVIMYFIVQKNYKSKNDISKKENVDKSV
nr:solute carrier family 23 protein [Geomicrobium halophilum]